MYTVNFSISDIINTNLLRYLIDSIALMLVFHKCGGKRFRAWIPCLRTYEHGRCAGAEDEGRIAAFAELVTYVSALALFLASITQYEFSLERRVFNVAFNINASTKLSLVLCVIILVAASVFMIYAIRIDFALCRMFKRSRLWVILFFFVEEIPMLIFGLVKSYQPQHRVDEDNGAAPLVNAKAPVLDQGLTINIKARTVLDSLKKKYLLRDIHLDIEPGTMVLLLGGSGAGKTTFVNAVTGYEKADAQIELNKEDVYHSFRKMKYKIGFVPQADLMRTADTVEATLRDAAVMRMPRTCTREDREKRIREVLDLFGLTPVRHSLVEKLSGGQRKRLSIAIEYISDPQLFILDEPDSGLDGVIAKDLMAHLHGISREGGRIVMVITHTPDRVIDQFDKVIVLAKDANRTGRLAFYGSIEEARTFFGKQTMEEILLSINQKVEGGEGRADEFIQKYNDLIEGKNNEPTPPAQTETATA